MRERAVETLWKRTFQLCMLYLLAPVVLWQVSPFLPLLAWSTVDLTVKRETHRFCPRAGRTKSAVVSVVPLSNPPSCHRYVPHVSTQIGAYAFVWAFVWALSRDRYTLAAECARSRSTPDAKGNTAKGAVRARRPVGCGP
jgi:hypothetical protein